MLKTAFRSALVGFVVFGTASMAHAQQYPTKIVRIVAPFAPGGGTDFIARLMASKLGEGFGNQVIVENRPGAGATIGTEYGIKQPPDGYTLTMIAASYTINPSLYKLNFDPVNDITPIVQIARGPFLVVVHPSMPVKTMKELIAIAKAKPGAINYSTAGQGTITHLATELFGMMANVKLNHIPYGGTGPATTSTISGETTLLFGSIATTIGHAKSGRLRAIAVTTAKRVPALPNVPAIDETVKGYDVTNWHGLIGPKGLPRAIADRVNGEVNKIIKQKEMIDKLESEGVAPVGGTPEEFLKVIQRETPLWKKVTDAAKVTVQ